MNRRKRKGETCGVTVILQGRRAPNRRFVSSQVVPLFEIVPDDRRTIYDARSRDVSVLMPLQGRKRMHVEGYLSQDVEMI